MEIAAAMSDKEKYRQVCAKFNLPVFMQEWWMDAVCGPANWMPVLAYDGGGETEAVMLCYFFRKWKFNFIIPAPFTPFSGIWIRPLHQELKAHALGQREIDLSTQLISKLPSSYFFIQQFHYSFQNWLSFYWKDFKQTTRYTYVLEDLNNLDKVYNNFKGNIRTAIKKAESTLKVENSEDAAIVFDLISTSLSRKQVRFPLSKEKFINMDKELDSKHSRKIYLACDEENHIHAAIYTIWDASTTYLLLSGVNKVHQNTTALSLLIWKAIQDAAVRGHTFDFEGSTLPHIEPFFRSFGGERKSYFRISKAKNKFWEVLFLILGKS
jgi:hypothetical protein